MFQNLEDLGTLNAKPNSLNAFGFEIPDIARVFCLFHRRMAKAKGSNRHLPKYSPVTATHYNKPITHKTDPNKP